MSTEKTKEILNMYDPTREYGLYKHGIDTSISKVLNHGIFINGPEVKELEECLSGYTGIKHCICVGNGTDALQIAIMALDLKPDDEIITVAHTWISSSEVISLMKCKPVFVDIERETFNIDPTKIESVITEKTKAILTVNLYGQLPDYNLIQEIAQKYSLFVIEDGAQSFGSSQNSQKSCSFGDIGTTSFFPTKPLGCYGDGGACFTNNDELATKIRAIKNHGGTARFCHDLIGVNSRLDSIQAAVLLNKMTRFDEDLLSRQKVATKYSTLLKPLESSNNLILPKIKDNNTHAWAQYTIQTMSMKIRDDVLAHLKENNVNCSVFYRKPLHYQKCFEYLGAPKNPLNVSEDICDRIFNVPIYSYLKYDEVEHVCSIINDFFKNIQ
jgi:UDP-2-acetamido-2-deoxy-ribo-hexuluronate aminotransferase